MAEKDNQEDHHQKSNDSKEDPHANTPRFNGFNVKSEMLHWALVKVGKIKAKNEADHPDKVIVVEKFTWRVLITGGVRWAKL